MISERATARHDGLVITGSEAEVLVYDQRSHHVHHLNAISANVWRACDGSRSVEAIAGETGLPVAAVEMALHQLALAGLLDGSFDLEPDGSRRQTRRLLLAAGGAAVAIPAIVSVTAPAATAQASGCPILTSDQEQCWWIRNFEPHCWIDPSPIYPDYDFSYENCQEWDQCSDGGACYGWGTTTDGLQPFSGFPPD